MDRAAIVEWIREWAARNGRAPGKAQFERETGLREGAWEGRYWATWSAALEEAGLGANRWNSRLDDDVIMSALVLLIRELGRFPTKAERKLKRRADPSFPSHGTFDRWGSKAEQVNRVMAFCEATPGCEDVAALLRPLVSEAPAGSGTTTRPIAEVNGVVYLVKMDRYYKIGQTKSLGRREYELNLQLPRRAEVVHHLETDDPIGIERYWHERFAAKRTNGEWFRLTPEDVAAFRKRGRSM